MNLQEVEDKRMKELMLKLLKTRRVRHQNRTLHCTNSTSMI